MEINLNTPFSNHILIENQAYLYFGGTAYLGIPDHEEFINLYLEGIRKFGLNNGTSRTNNIQLGIYEEAERYAAKRFCAESALITSSGYLAAQLTVNAVSGFGQVLYAPASHPALWMAHPQASVISFAEWKTQALNQINNSVSENWVLISNSMNNLLPEIYDFSFLEAVGSNKNIILVVDDSHGIGVNHGGLSAYHTLPKRSNIECIVVASMAKALGVDAGLILASDKMIEQLKNTAHFAGASPPSAAGLYAFMHAEHIYKQEWEKLQHNISLLKKNLSKEWLSAAGFPAFFLDDPELGNKLIRNKILISSFHYPTKESPLINRIVLSSWHSPKDLDQLISVLSANKRC